VVCALLPEQPPPVETNLLERHGQDAVALIVHMLANEVHAPCVCVCVWRQQQREMAARVLVPWTALDRAHAYAHTRRLLGARGVRALPVCKTGQLHTTVITLPLLLAHLGPWRTPLARRRRRPP
jgi:hypothetical protein